MATPVRTYTFDTNNAVPVGSLSAGYQAAAFGIKEAFLNAGTGATGILSSNGTTAGAGDNWASSADVVLGTAGNGSWWSAQLGVSMGGGSLFVLLYVNESTVTLAASGSVFECLFSLTAWSGGSTSALPTTSGPASTAGSANHNLFPSSSTGNDLSWSVWYSNFGDVFYWAKEDAQQGISVARQLLIFNDTAGGGGGTETHRFIYRRTANSATSSAWTTTPLSTGQVAYGTLSNAFNVSGQLNAPNLTLSPTNGLSTDGDVATSLGTHFIASQRYLGVHPDLYYCRNLLFETLDADEAGQTIRRVNLGDVMVFWPDADLPLP